MKNNLNSRRYILVVMILAGLFVGCQTDAVVRTDSIATPEGEPATSQLVMTNVPEQPSLTAGISENQNDATPPTWKLEPITAANVQQMSFLARFGEGGLNDEMALSPDGLLLALASNGGVVLYDAFSGEWLDFYPTSSNVTSLAFYPDSQQLAYIFRVPGEEKFSASDPDFAGQEIFKPILTVRSIPNGEILYSLPLFGNGCGEYAAWDLLFNSDGSLILFDDYFGWPDLPKTGSLCVLDAQNGSLLRVIEPEKPWRVTDFTPLLSDGKTVWALSVDDSKAVEAGIYLTQLRRYNLETGLPETQLDLPNLSNLHLSPDQQWLVIGDKSAQIRSAIDGSLIAEIEPENPSTEENNQFSAAVFSPDSSTLALGAWDGSVSLYSVPHGQLLSRMEPVAVSTIFAKEEALHVVNLLFSTDGSILYILLNSYFVDTPVVIRAVRLADGQEVFRLSGRNTVDRHPSLSADNALLAWGGYEDGSVQVWSVTNGKMNYRLDGHTGTVLQTLFSPDGRQLATASMDGTVRLWNAVDGTPLTTLSGHEGGVWAIEYTSDGSQLVSIGMDGMLKLWNTIDGRNLKTIASGTGEWQVNSVSLSPDNRIALVASGCLYLLNCRAGGMGDLRSIDLETGQITTLLARSIIDFNLSANQSTFGLFGDGEVQFGQISSNQYQIQQTFTSPYGNKGVYGVAISSDGSLLFSGNMYGIHVWDIASGQMVSLVQDRIGRGYYGTMQFSSDGRIVMIAGDDGVIYLWGIDSDQQK